MPDYRNVKQIPMAGEGEKKMEDSGKERSDMVGCRGLKKKVRDRNKWMEL